MPSLLRFNFLAPKKTWKKGQSGNLKGRPKLPDDIKEARTLNQIEFERTINKFLFESKRFLDELLESEQSTVFELMIAKMLQKAINEGDYQRINFLMDRIVGKAKETIDHNLKGVPDWVVSLYQMPAEKRRQRFKEMQKKRKKK